MHRCKEDHTPGPSPRNHMCKLRSPLEQGPRQLCYFYLLFKVEEIDSFLGSVFFCFSDLVEVMVRPWNMGSSDLFSSMPPGISTYALEQVKTKSLTPASND